MMTSRYAMFAATALAFIAPAVAIAASPDCRSHKEAERYIAASEAEWAASVPTNDSSVVKRILADDVVWVLDGDVVDKRAAIRGAEEGPGDFVANHLLYAHVRIFGDMAVVQGSEAWEKKGGDKGRFVWTDTWLCRDGQWQIIAAEDVSVPEAGEPASPASNTDA